MQYDPIKKSLGKFFNASPVLRILFYKLLDVLLLRAWHIKKEVNRIKKEIGKDAYILDAGAGFGQYVHYLSRLSNTWKIKGVDIKQEQIEDCNRFFRNIQKNDRVTFAYADLTTFSEPDSYDMILAVDVMEHIEEDVKVFQNFYHSLKKDGYLIISTPSDQGGSDVHDESDESFIDEHVRDGYGIEDITEKLKSAGFQQVKTRYSYGDPGKLSWKLSMKYPILLLNASKLFFLLLPLYYILFFPIALMLNAFDISMAHASGTGLIVTAKK